uniref:Uncharacterized protein n=1 Tax=Spironucleus barkhanus TaxID=103874 RepID=A1Y028_SPIBA|nr:hypothetical protein [Spironucleus barkhanus]
MACSVRQCPSCWLTVLAVQSVARPYFLCSRSSALCASSLRCRFRSGLPARFRLRSYGALTSQHTAGGGAQRTSGVQGAIQHGGATSILRSQCCHRKLAFMKASKGRLDRWWYWPSWSTNLARTRTVFTLWQCSQWQNCSMGTRGRKRICCWTMLYMRVIRSVPGRLRARKLARAASVAKTLYTRSRSRAWFVRSRSVVRRVSVCENPSCSSSAESFAISPFIFGWRRILNTKARIPQNDVLPLRLHEPDLPVHAPLRELAGDPAAAGGGPADIQRDHADLPRPEAPQELHARCGRPHGGLRPPAVQDDRADRAHERLPTGLLHQAADPHHALAAQHRRVERLLRALHHRAPVLSPDVTRGSKTHWPSEGDGLRHGGYPDLDLLQHARDPAQLVDHVLRVVDQREDVLRHHLHVGVLHYGQGAEAEHIDLRAGRGARHRGHGLQDVVGGNLILASEVVQLRGDAAGGPVSVNEERAGSHFVG